MDHLEVGKCYHPDFWPKSRLGRALAGETKLGRGKHSCTSQLILLKSLTEVIFLSSPSLPLYILAAEHLKAQDAQFAPAFLATVLEQ